MYRSFTTNRANSEIRQVRKMNNIMEFMSYGPVFLQVKSKGGTIAWRKKD